VYFTQGLKNAIQLKSNAIATIDGKRRQTWKELGGRVAKLAGALKTLGLPEGGRAAILALNSDRYFEYYYAVPWAGGVFVPLNIRLAPPELIFLLNDSGTEILLVDDEFASTLPALVDKLETVRHIVRISDHAPQANTLDYEAILEAADPIPDAIAGGAELAGIFYTGGTTGLPKGVMLSHDNLIFNALNALIVSGYNANSLYLHAAPMFHMADATSVCGLTMVQGTHVFIPKYDPETTLRVIAAEKNYQCHVGANHDQYAGEFFTGCRLRFVYSEKNLVWRFLHAHGDHEKVHGNHPGLPVCPELRYDRAFSFGHYT
jgi:long-chain acyl-CoA synthetase